MIEPMRMFTQDDDDQMSAGRLRKGRTHPLTKLEIFTLTLKAPREPDRIVEWGIGKDEIESFIESCNRVNALLPGETLKIGRIKIDLLEVRR